MTPLRANAEMSVFSQFVKQGEWRQYDQPFKNAPRVCSSRLASRESGSFKHFMNQLRLCNRSRAVATHLASFSRAWTHSSDRGHMSRLVAGRKEASPAAHDVLIRPALGHDRIQPHQQVHMIVQDRKPGESA